jgi:hypothetical protein
MIHPDDLLPIELMMLRTHGPNTFSPVEFNEQYLEIADREAWSLYRAHAMGQDVDLPGYLWLRRGNAA